METESKKIKKKSKFSKYLESKGFSLFGFVCLIYSNLIIISSVILFFFTDSSSIKSRLAFNALESFMMIVYLLFPIFVRKTLKIEIPKLMLTIYIVFCASAQILGEIMDFYGRIPWWDSLLHGFSGVLLGVLGFILINTINNIEKTHIKLNPIFISIAVVCFAVTLGVLWELIEYSIDGIFGSNMQQFMESTSGTLVGGEDIPLQGHDALTDTMKDLFLVTFGATIIAVIGYFQLKHEKKGSTHTSLKIIHENNLKVDNSTDEILIEKNDNKDNIENIESKINQSKEE